MYMTPANCFYFMKLKQGANAEPSNGKEPPGGKDPYSGRFYQIYRTLLVRMLHHRFIVLTLVFVTLAAGVFAATKLVSEFFGPSDRNQFLVYVDLPAGSNIRATDDVIKRLTGWLSNKKENPEITSTIAYVGTGGPRFFLTLSPPDPDPHVASLVVNTESADQAPTVIRRLRERFLTAFPEVNGRVKQMWLGASEPGLVEIRLIGPDAEVLYEKGNQLMAALKAMPGTLNLRSDWQNKVLKAEVLVDQARASRAQISSRSVAYSLESHIDGVKVTEYREEDVAIPVILQSADEERESFGDLTNVSVYSGLRGANVPILQIATGKGKWEFDRISHWNQERTLTTELVHETLKAPQLLSAIEPLIQDLELKEGYRWEVGGELETREETMGKLAQNMPFCIFGIIVLLIWQFNSFRRPGIILFTIPLAFTGAFFGLLILRAPFDFFGMLGLLSLAGVIINNGIVLIDRIDSERASGTAPYQAVIKSAISRFRPILMTTITTILGVMPLIISVDALFFSMAAIIAFGLAFGTVLTLGVVPVLYAILFRVRDEART
jgi:multidrug efflux pump subunit AcrB